jgi:tetratricopeptide (TPR) repeat protein
METENNLKPVESFADKFSAWVIIAIIFLIPVIFIPSNVVPFQFTKVIVLYIGVIVSLIAWIIARLNDGKLSYSRHGVFLALGGIVLTYLAAAAFSPAKYVSFIGQGFEVSTFAFIAVMAIFVFLVSHIFVNRQRSAYVYLAFLASFVVIALYQLIRLLGGPSVLGFGIFTTPTDNLVGSWNDLGIFFGATALFSFISLELLRMPKMMRSASIAVLAISFFFLTVVSFSSIWYLLGIFALIFFIYNFSFNKARTPEASPVIATTGRRSVPVTSLVVLIVCFMFALVKGNIYSTLSSGLGIHPLSRFAVENVEVSPSWTSTYDVAKASIAKHPLFGVGPNRFLSQWLLSKPAAINNTIFWATDFNYGIGFIPSLLVTTGIVGFLAWLVFLGYFLYLGFKVLFTRVQDSFSMYLSISSFILSLYFWIFSIMHVPSAALLVLTFAFTGIFFASAIDSKQIATSTYDIVKNPARSFVSVLVLIGAMLGVVIFGYSIIKHYVASIYFNQALKEANVNGNIPAAEADLAHALQFSQDDFFYRTLSQLNLLKINVLFQQQNAPQDLLKTQFQNDISTAVAAAQAAYGADKTNYLNILNLGNVAAVVVPLNSSGAYEQAMASYNQARQFNPMSPAILLTMAQLEVAHKNPAQAKADIMEALKLKNDYTDAIYLLAQIQIGEGDLKSAIQSVEAITYTKPNDPGVYFQLGLLRYNNKDYAGTASAMTQALTLSPDYANAKYFLGLADAKLGKTQDAIALFEDIQKTNPDNTELQKIISNLKAGHDPVASLPPPNNTPEKSTKPVVKDKTSPAATTANQ